jgi:hypothetical protein
MPHRGTGDPASRDLAAPRVFFQTSLKSPSANPVAAGPPNPDLAVLANIRLEGRVLVFSRPGRRRDRTPAP